MDGPNMNTTFEKCSLLTNFYQRSDSDRQKNYFLKLVQFHKIGIT